jgi:uncharacterized protein (TIGR01777 family)
MAAAIVAAGADVVILTRRARSDLGYRQVVWDGHTVGSWAKELDDAIVVNLAGEIVDRPPTPANIELLTRSRVEPTRALVQASHEVQHPPRVWLQMSTLAIYGDAGEDVITEDHPPADGPPQMAGVARAWEDAVADAATQRLVVLRTAVVLDPGTPAFDRLRSLTRLGLGGRIASGRQWVSWIHVEDYLNAVRFIARREQLSGVVHVTAPEPIRNGDMMASLRRAFHRPWSPPTPRFAVHVGASLMRSDPALALTGRRCVPKRLEEQGFPFRYRDFDAALTSLT